MELLIANYIFNMCSVINNQTNNKLLELYPHSKLIETDVPKIGEFILKNKKMPHIIHAYCQIYPGLPKYHNDHYNLRLRWFEQVLNLMIEKLHQIKIIAFMIESFDEKYLFKINNFVKKYQLIHGTSIKIIDFYNKSVDNLDIQRKINIYHINSIQCESQLNMGFNYKIVDIINKSDLFEYLDNVKSNYNQILDSNQESKNDNCNQHTPDKDTHDKDTHDKDTPDKDTPDKDPPNKDPDKDPPNKDPDKDPPNKDPDKDPDKDLPNKDPPNKDPPDNTTNQLVSDNELNKKLVKKLVRIRKNRYIDLFNELEPLWSTVLFGDNTLHQLLKNINDDLINQINDEKKDVLPYPFDLTFNCFKLCNENNVKVVILGQDPYFSNKNEAMGLSFSVPDNVKIPPTLINIFTELKSDIPNFTIPNTGNLTKWANQGVLLLNTSLTVIHKLSGCHINLWKPFTTEIINRISSKLANVVFMLWGAHAIKYKSMIPSTKHLILESCHPSPLSASKGWFGNHHFSKCNEYLTNNNKDPINWIL